MPVPFIDLRSAFVSAVTNPASGFNARLAALAAAYSFPVPYTIDFSNVSTAFFQGYLQPESSTWDLSQLSTFPAMAVYCKETENLNRTKFSRFDGNILFCVDLFVKFRVVAGVTDSLETNDTDTVMDLSEQALMESIDILAARGGSPLLPANIVYQGNVKTVRSPIVLYGDARAQLLHVEIPFACKQ